MTVHNEASENYLEAILILEKQGSEVRMSDVATLLNVSKPSVNKAMNNLKENGYILQQHYGSIQLTEEGRKYAARVYERHLLFKQFFVGVLGIDEAQAEEDACRMEHCISDKTMKKLKAFMIDTMKVQKPE